MPIRMYKGLLLHAKISELIKSINRKVVLHAYNYSCIPQMAIYRLIFINKGIKY